MTDAPAEHTVHAGDATATIVATGATLRSYTSGGRELLDGFGRGEAPSGARGLPLLPWPNRIRDGRYRWGGRDLQLPVNEEDKGTALHGLVADMAWKIVAASHDAVVFSCRIDHAPGYPFVLDLQVRFALSDDGLTVATTGHNADDTALPYGAGFHPYLCPTTPTIDDCELFAVAHSYLPPDERGIPLDVVPVGGTPFDFRTGRSLAGVMVDACFTDLERDTHGRAEVRLTDAHGAGALVWLDDSYRYVQLYSGDTLPEVHRRRGGFAVEPMTCPPNAFQSGVDVITLEPGQSVTSVWGMRPLP